MLRRIVASFGLLLVLAAASVSSTPAFAKDPSNASGRLVAIVLAPSLTWDDVDSMPFTRALAERSAVGDVNARLSPKAGTSPFTAGALTLSSGDVANSEDRAPAAYSIDEPYQGGDAGEAYTRYVGEPAKGSAIVYLGLERQARANATAQVQVSLGAFGQAVVASGLRTAAIGCGDPGFDVEPDDATRPAAIVAMDALGRVSLGDVSPRMLETDTLSPFGVRSDRDAIMARVSAAVSAMKGDGGPGAIVVDPGDLGRAILSAPDSSEGNALAQRQRALRRLDSIVSDIRAAIPEDAVLMIVTPPTVVIPRTGPAGLAPVIVSGTGFNGLIDSTATHRPGIGTTPDIPVTALSVMGISRPLAMSGSPMRSKPAGGLAERIGYLKDREVAALSIDGAKMRVVNTYITLTAVLLILCTLLLLRHDWPRPLVAGLKLALLLDLAVPVSATLMLLAVPVPPTPDIATVALVVTAVVLALAAWTLKRPLPAIGWPGGEMMPVTFLALLTAGMVLLDQFLGAPWAIKSFFSYSPLLGARYYGIGNEGAAVLAGSTLLALGLAYDGLRRREGARTALGAWLVPAIGVVCVVTAAAPFLGANIGVAGWGIVAFAVMWTELTGRRLTWKTVLVALLAVVVLVAAFAVYDISAGGAQTHVGRALASAQEGGIGELWVIVQRKAETNLRVLTHSNWSWLLLVILVVLGYMRMRPQGEFAETMRENPGFKGALTAALLGGLVAYFTEDSGIVIPALIMLPIGVALVFLMVARWRDGEEL